MTIKTYSAFTYGHTVNDENQYFSLDEGSGEVLVALDVGSYTLGTFVNSLATKLNEAAGLANSYTAILDRTERKITITADGTFDLLIGTGQFVGSDLFGLIGFTGDDLTGQLSYTGNIGSGSQFEPQAKLQMYIPFKNNVKTTQANINTTASGSVEVVSYGQVRFMECSIIPQTDIPQAKGSYIKDDPNGEDNLRDFLSYCITKAPIEFVPDYEGQPGVFSDCLLESTSKSSKGVDFQIKELYASGYAEWFDSGRLTFREII